MNAFVGIPLGIVGVLIVVGSAGLLVLRLTGPGAEDVPHGVQNDRLSDCPSSPNCVSTQSDVSDRAHYVEPIAVPAGEDLSPADLQSIAEQALAQEPRVTFLKSSPTYIRVEARSRLFGFVDDVEVYIPEGQNVIHFRSASRVGKGDMGVNRGRYERFRARVTNRVAPRLVSRRYSQPRPTRPRPRRPRLFLRVRDRLVTTAQAQKGRSR